MPIVALRLVLAPSSSTPHGLTQCVADELGKVFACGPGQVWVQLSTLAAPEYAENLVAIGEEEFPVFVTLLHADLPTSEVRAVEALRVCQAIARCVGRPVERVHLEYAPSGRGRVAFGGKLLE